MSSCKRKKECYYAMQDERGTDRKHCGYILITGEPRGCPVDKCDKFRSKRERESEEQEQTEAGAEAGEAAVHTESQAVQPVDVSVLRYDKGRGERG